MLGLGFALTNFGTKGGVVDTPDLSGSSAAALLAAYGGEGFSMIFDSTAPSLKIADSTTPSNDWDSDLGDGYSVQDFFKNRSFTSYTGPVSTSKRLMQADGYIKPCRHNLVAMSNKLNATGVWTAATATISKETSVTDPFGGTDVFTLTEDGTAAAQHRFYATNTYVANVPFTLSVYAKEPSSNSRRYFALSMRRAASATEWYAVTFDLQSGAVNTGLGTAGTTGTYLTSAITSVGGGWYRCSVTGSLPNTDFVIMCGLSDGSALGASGQAIYNGNSTSKLHFYGMQVNNGYLLDYVSSEAHNLCLQSQTFQTTWSPTNTGVTADATTAPDGTTTADKLTETAVTDTFRVSMTITSISGTNYTCTVRAKAAERSWVLLRTNFGSVIDSYFNCSTGAQGTIGSGHTAHTPVALANGWYEFSVTVASTTTGSSFFNVGPANADAAGSYAGTLSSGIYVWGAQVELSSAPGKYVATTAAAVYNPHFDLPVEYNTDGTVKALTREEARTNLLQRSGLFSNVIWTKSAACSITDNQVTSAFGIVDGTLVSFTGNGYIQQQVTSATGVHTAWSIVKAGTASYFRLSIFDSAHREAWFNLSAGTVGTTGSGVSATIESLGNGWYICTNTYTTTAANPYHESYFCQSDNTTPVNGDTGYCCHSQIEAAATRSSVIVTGSSTVTRAADDIRWSTSIFPLDASFGTAYVKGYITTAGKTQGAFAINDNTINERIHLRTDGGQIVFTDGGVSQTSITVGGWSANTTTKFAIAYQLNDIAAVKDGGTVRTDPSATIPTVYQVILGGLDSGSPYMTGGINEFAYFPTRLANATLQTLTTA